MEKRAETVFLAGEMTAFPMLGKTVELMSVRLTMNAHKGPAEDTGLSPDQIVQRIKELAHEVDNAWIDFKTGKEDPGPGLIRLAYRVADLQNWGAFLLNETGAMKQVKDVLQ